MTTTPESLPYTNVSSCLHILILDDVGTPSVEHKNTTYTDFIHQQHGDNVKILLITSKGAVSEQDKIQCLEWHELEPYPTRNGLLEVLGN